MHLAVEDRAPESGESVGIGTVDRKLGEFTGHGWTSQSNGVEHGLDLRVKRKQPSTTAAASTIDPSRAASSTMSE
jgi:hypothetical protein